MNPKVDKKKTKTPRERVSFRLSKEDGELLEQFSSEMKIPLSKFMRDAMRNYIFMFYINPALGNPQMVFSRNIVARSFDFLSDEQVEELSIMAYENAQHSFESYKKLMGMEVFSKYQFNTFLEFLEGSAKGAYTSTAQNWLDSINYSSKKSGITVYATHELGTGFSKFFKSLLVKHAQRFKLDLKDHKFHRKQLSLSNPEEKDHIVLKFVKKVD